MYYRLLDKVYGDIAPTFELCDWYKLLMLKTDSVPMVSETVDEDVPVAPSAVLPSNNALSNAPSDIQNNTDTSHVPPMLQQVPMPLPVGPFNVSEGNAVAVSNFVDAIIGDPSLESHGGFVLLSAPIVLSVQLDDSIVAFTCSCLNKLCAHIIHVLHQ